MSFPSSRIGFLSSPRIRKFAEGSALLSAGLALVSVCGLVRSILIARSISVEDYGVAAAILATLALVQMATDIATSKQLLQDPDGGSDAFLAAAHALSLTRGLICGVLMYLLAGPAATFFGLPEALSAFQLVALAPVLSCFIHYDYRALQRQSIHRPAVAVNTIPHIIVTVLVVPVLIIWPDYRAALFVCLAQPVLWMAISHAQARRSYRISFDVVLLTRMVVFAWPLMLSGLLMYGVFQGDKYVVGYFFDAKVLGYYALAFTFFLFPGQILHHLYNALTLAAVSRAFQEAKGFERVCSVLWSSLLILCGVYLLFCLSVGPSVMVWIFGSKSEAAAEVIPWLSMMVGIRILRIQPSILTLAVAYPKGELLANLARSSAIPLSIFGVSIGYGIAFVAAAAFLGEVLALMVGGYALYRRKVDVGCWLGGKLMPGLLVCVVVLALILESSRDAAAVGIFCGALAVTIVLAMCAVFVQEVRGFLSEQDGR